MVLLDFWHTRIIYLEVVRLITVKFYVFFFFWYFKALNFFFAACSFRRCDWVEFKNSWVWLLKMFFLITFEVPKKKLLIYLKNMDCFFYTDVCVNTNYISFFIGCQICFFWATFCMPCFVISIYFSIFVVE